MSNLTNTMKDFAVNIFIYQKSDKYLRLTNIDSSLEAKQLIQFGNSFNRYKNSVSQAPIEGMNKVCGKNILPSDERRSGGVLDTENRRYYT